jgi:hypothetical protein
VMLKSQGVRFVNLGSLGILPRDARDRNPKRKSS